MGKKYIIELEEEVKGLCKAKGFNTLVFDKDGISKLTPYEEKKEGSKGRWYPHHGEKYWHIVRSEVGNCYEWDGGSIDKSMMSIGNVFRTKGEAEFALERLRVIAELKEYAVPEGTPWEEFIHYCIAYDHGGEKIYVSMSVDSQTANIHFRSIGDALNAIHAVGEERIKKYYFGIK